MANLTGKPGVLWWNCEGGAVILPASFTVIVGSIGIGQIPFRTWARYCSNDTVRFCPAGVMPVGVVPGGSVRSEEHTSELQSLMRISYAVFCLKKKTNKTIFNSTAHLTSA